MLRLLAIFVVLLAAAEHSSACHCDAFGCWGCGIGDPEFCEYVHGTEKPLCYNFHRDNGDIYRLLTHDSGLTVDVELGTVREGGRQYMTLFGIVFDGCKFVVNPTGLTGGCPDEDVRIIPWLTRTKWEVSEFLNISFDGTRIVFDANGVVQLYLTLKKGSTMNFKLKHIGGSDVLAGGLISDLRNDITVTGNKDGEVNEPDGSVQAIHFYDDQLHNILKMNSKNSNVFDAIIKENQVDCITC